MDLIGKRALKSVVKVRIWLLNNKSNCEKYCAENVL